MFVLILFSGRVRPDGFPSQARVEVGAEESTYWGTLRFLPNQNIETVWFKV